MALFDRHGVAIWWWDAEAMAHNEHRQAIQTNEILPEPVCQPLEDGFHHLHLAEGFEARFIRSGMVVGSVWRRTPFDRLAWQAFLEAHDAAPGQLAAGPPVAVEPPAATAARPLAGRRLVRVVHPRDRLLVAALLATAMAGAWWQGQAAAIETNTLRMEAEASRMAAILQNYGLMAAARDDLARLAEARATAGQGAAAVRLARVLQLAAGRRVQVREIRIDGKALDMIVFAGDEPARIRALATDIESLPEFSAVLGSSGPEKGEARLSARLSA